MFRTFFFFCNKITVNTVQFNYTGIVPIVCVAILKMKTFTCVHIQEVTSIIHTYFMIYVPIATVVYAGICIARIAVLVN